MIGHLAGKLLDKRPPYLLIDVNGVGYEVEATMSTFYRLAEIGEPCQLYTHFVVREDAQILYGFADWQERAMFRQLIRINGIGPKLALTILSGMSVEAFSLCLQSEDAQALTRLPGVGKKTAERLIIEMRDRLPATAQNGSAADAGVVAPIAVRDDPRADALSGLLALGYKAAEAGRLLDAVTAEGLSSAEMIRQALQAGVR